jgi:hypothetical protein
MSFLFSAPGDETIKQTRDRAILGSVHYSDTDIRDLGHSKNDGRGSYAAIGCGSLLRGRRPSAS